MENKIPSILIVEDPNLRPECATTSSIGFDLKAAESGIIKPGKVGRIPTGVKLNSEFILNIFNKDGDPPLEYLKNNRFEYTEADIQVRPKSGLNSRGILGLFGTIDGDYEGEIMAMLLNTTDQDFVYEKYDKIAQLVFTEAIKDPIDDPNLIQRNRIRGDGGFGSTGK